MNVIITKKGFPKEYKFEILEIFFPNGYKLGENFCKKRKK